MEATEIASCPGELAEAFTRSTSISRWDPYYRSKTTSAWKNGCLTWLQNQPKSDTNGCRSTSRGSFRKCPTNILHPCLVCIRATWAASVPSGNRQMSSSGATFCPFMHSKRQNVMKKISPLVRFDCFFDGLMPRNRKKPEVSLVFRTQSTAGNKGFNFEVDYWTKNSCSITHTALALEFTDNSLQKEAQDQHLSLTSHSVVSVLATGSPRNLTFAWSLKCVWEMYYDDAFKQADGRIKSIQPIRSASVPIIAGLHSKINKMRCVD